MKGRFFSTTIIISFEKFKITLDALSAYENAPIHGVPERQGNGFIYGLNEPNMCRCS